MFHASVHIFTVNESQQMLALPCFFPETSALLVDASSYPEHGRSSASEESSCPIFAALGHIELSWSRIHGHAL